MERNAALDELKALANSGTFVQVAPGKFAEWAEALQKDKLDALFEKQREFMLMLLEHDRLPEWPVSLQTKSGQRIIKEVVWCMVEEIAEASYTLKNRMHKVSDDRDFDYNHYVEELGDALAYYLEILILSGVDADELYNEYTRKNDIVKQRLTSGY